LSFRPRPGLEAGRLPGGGGRILRRCGADFWRVRLGPVIRGRLCPTERGPRVRFGGDGAVLGGQRGTTGGMFRCADGGGGRRQCRLELIDPRLDNNLGGRLAGVVGRVLDFFPSVSSSAPVPGDGTMGIGFSGARRPADRRPLPGRRTRCFPSPRRRRSAKSNKRPRSLRARQPVLITAKGDRSRRRGGDVRAARIPIVSRPSQGL